MDRCLCHLPGLAAVGTCSSIKDILAIMSDEEMLTSATRRPIINDSVIKPHANNLARNSADLKALNLLHDDLIIPCHRRELQ
jgi:hypothetical protein